MLKASIRLLANHTLHPGLRVCLFRLSGINIGKRVFINMHLNFIDDYKTIIFIDDEVSISPNVSIVAVSHPNHSFIREKYEISKEAVVRIKRGAWIGAGAVILPGVTIGVGAIVGAQALVNKNVEDYAIVVGVPARKIGDVREKKLKYK